LLTKLCYFSGTGNTLWSAKTIAQRIGGDYELINIGIEAQKKEITLEADAVILLFPSYAYGLPLIVRAFLQKAEFRTPYVAALVTFGTLSGGTLAAASRIFRRKNISAVYYGRIPAVENYIALLGEQKEKTIQRRLALQRDATEKAALGVIERQVNQVNTFRPFSVFVWLLFYLGIKIFYKWYRLSETCNGCGICQRICPVSAIAMQGERPRFSGACEHCQACILWCPQKAISFGRIKPHTRRYHHPEISLAEISRQ
jgi:ferredoxin